MPGRSDESADPGAGPAILCGGARRRQPGAAVRRGGDRVGFPYPDGGGFLVARTAGDVALQPASAPAAPASADRTGTFRPLDGIVLARRRRHLATGCCGEGKSPRRPHDGEFSLRTVSRQAVAGSPRKIGFRAEAVVAASANALWIPHVALQFILRQGNLQQRLTQPTAHPGSDSEPAACPRTWTHFSNATPIRL